MKRAFVAMALVAAVFAFDAGAQLPPPLGADSSRAEHIDYGVVEAIDVYREGSSSPISAGSVLGGLAGGVIGHQIGSGRGRDVATIAGVLGGAYVGNNIQKSNEKDRYRITVRLDNGTRMVLEEVGEGELRVGDRVHVVNNRVYRD